MFHSNKTIEFLHKRYKNGLLKKNYLECEKAFYTKVGQDKKLLSINSSIFLCSILERIRTEILTLIPLVTRFKLVERQRGEDLSNAFLRLLFVKISLGSTLARGLKGISLENARNNDSSLLQKMNPFHPFIFTRSKIKLSFV